MICRRCYSPEPDGLEIVEETSEGVALRCDCGEETFRQHDRVTRQFWVKYFAGLNRHPQSLAA